MWHAGSHYRFLGAFPSACEHLAQAVTLSTPQQQATIALFGMDLGVFGRSWLSHVLWHLGYLTGPHGEPGGPRPGPWAPV